MKITIEFNLPEEKEEYEIHHKANSLYCCLNAFSEKLRNMEKYENIEQVKIKEMRELLLFHIQEYELTEIL